MSNKDEIIAKLATSVETYSRKDAVEAAMEVAAVGIDPVEAINEGLVKGMNVVGELYGECKIYLPQVLTAAHAMYGALDILLPLIPADTLAESKTACVCVVEGDVHDIGKNILKTMLTAGGFIVTDLGKDIPPDEVATTVKSKEYDILCMSTLMTPTMDNMRKTIKILEEKDSRMNVIVTIGGPPTSSQFAEEIGANHRDKNAQNAVEWIKGAT